MYALENNIERLAADHYHAKLLANALQQKDFVKTILPVETNIVIFEPVGKYTGAELANAFKKKDILVIAISKTQVRMVTHLDVNTTMIDETIGIINDL